MSARGRQLLWLLIGVGTVVRVVVAFKTYGVSFDIDSLRLVAERFDDAHLHVYSALNPASPDNGATLYRWPYPPGYFPWIGASVRLAVLTGLPFHGLIQLPSIAADGALAWLVQHVIGRRGGSERLRLLAAGLVALGPSFAVVSGYQGQIDALAILPALAAMVVWERADLEKRAMWAGLLLGAGGAIKTVPLIMILALLPSARSRREGVALVLWAAVIPVLALAPFFVADPSGVIKVFRYPGAPGLGGLSLLAQPDLLNSWLKFSPYHPNFLTDALLSSNSAIVLAALACYAAFVGRFRPSPPDAAVLLWLTVYVFSPNFFIHYLVWGLPFFLVAGYVRAVLGIQIFMAVPTLILYLATAPGHPFKSDGPVVLYAGFLIALWVGWVVALCLQGRTIVRARKRFPRGVLPYLSAPGAREADPAAG